MEGTVGGLLYGEARLVHGTVTRTRRGGGSKPNGIGGHQFMEPGGALPKASGILVLMGLLPCPQAAAQPPVVSDEPWWTEEEREEKPALLRPGGLPDELEMEVDHLHPPGAAPMASVGVKGRDEDHILRGAQGAPAVSKAKLHCPFHDVDEVQIMVEGFRHGGPYAREVPGVGQRMNPKGKRLGPQRVGGIHDDRK